MLRWIGWSLIILGLMIVATSLLAGNVSTSGFGGVLMIGPIPIVFGSSPDIAIVAMISAILLMLISVAFWRR